jgi:hypothetical protein
VRHGALRAHALERARVGAPRERGVRRGGDRDDRPRRGVDGGQHVAELAGRGDREQTVAVPPPKAAGGEHAGRDGHHFGAAAGAGEGREPERER